MTYIVQTGKEEWLAMWGKDDGLDVCLNKGKAKRFITLESAERALKSARERRQLRDAKIIKEGF